MFKSLFILLSSVALLTAGASLQTGALRLGEVSQDGLAEFREDLKSAGNDLRAIWTSLEDTPRNIQALVTDAREDFTALKTDAAQQARSIGRRISTQVTTRVNTGS